MRTKDLLLVLLINFGAGLLAISSFLPGPANELVNLFYNGGQIFGLIGLIGVPFGLVWTMKELRRRKNNNQYQFDKKAILILTLPVTLFLAAIYLSGHARDFSRDFAINRTDGLIQAIEEFRAKKGEYPDSLTQLTPEFVSRIPSPFIMGIDNYYYKKQGETYSISFYQNVTFNFNYEVVTFDPTDNHTAEGESITIYDTGQSHWKYYVYD
jgi:hypothetical protein